jgi:hypothetical protein
LISRVDDQEPESRLLEVVTDGEPGLAGTDDEHVIATVRIPAGFPS